MQKQQSCSETPGQRSYKTVLFQQLERDLGLPEGVLSEGSLRHDPQSKNQAVWTTDGGVIQCVSKDTAEVIMEAIRSVDFVAIRSDFENLLKKKCRTVQSSLNMLFACDSKDQIVANSLQGLVEKDSPAGLEFPLAVVKKEGKVVSHAYRVRQAPIDDERFFYAVEVATEEKHRRSGLGKAVVTALTEQIVSEGGVALWNCDINNEASVNLALSCGFTPTAFVMRWSL
jgi:hypothetical protein